MKSKLRAAAMLLAVLILITALSGCVTKSAEELYCLPALSEEYVVLQEQLNRVLQSGAGYSAPISGSNRQAVQLQDIDGDGVNEAIAFFNCLGEENPLKIYVFECQDDTYYQACVIEGTGTRFESISYTDMNGDGVSEFLVGWQISSELKMLTAYTIEDYRPTVILNTDYTDYTVSDMNADGWMDLVVVRLSSSELSGEVELYALRADGELASCVSRMSDGVEALSHARTGALRDGTPSVCLESAIDATNIVTDIFIYRQGTLQNITLDTNAGVSAETIRSYSVYCRDMNADGVLEVPKPVQMPSVSGADSTVWGANSSFWAIEWYDYLSTGRRVRVLVTYHNNTDGWYLSMPDSWEGKVAVRREDSSTGARMVIFSEYDSATQQVGSDFLTIYTLTGDTADERAESEGYFVLQTTKNTVYAAQILTDHAPVELSEAMVKENFKIIYSEWMSGETH